MSLCTELPDGGHYMITGRHAGVRFTSLSKMLDSQLVYIKYILQRKQVTVLRAEQEVNSS